MDSKPHYADDVIYEGDKIKVDMEQKRNEKKRAIIVIIIAIVLIGTCGLLIYNTSFNKLSDYIKEANCAGIVRVYNNKVSGDKSQEKKYDDVIKGIIKEIVSLWENGEVDYAQTKDDLEKLCKIDNKGLSKLAQEQLKFISIEEKGDNQYEMAEANFDNAEYLKSFKNLAIIDESYSRYEAVEEFSKQCENILLALISAPTSIKEYNEYKKIIDKYISIKDTSAFQARKQEIIDKRPEFMDAAPTLKQAKKFFNNKKYKLAFDKLTGALNEYPNNEFIRDALDEYRTAYVVLIAQMVKIQVNKEQYDKAFDSVEDAIAVYDCEDIRTIESYVREEKYSIIKYKNNVVYKIKSIAGRWNPEELDVHQAKDDARAYVIKSGKKLALGEYDKENITVLSVSGELATSLLGVDLALDVRDLSYDVTHWGEEDYFALRIAGDAIAIVPIIGAVKYLKYSREGVKTVKTGVKSAREVIGGTSKAAKATNKVLDTSTSITKNARQSEKVAIELIKHYKMIPDLPNQALDEVNGIPMEMKHLDYSDGRKLMGKFPKFDSKYNVQLPVEKYKLSREAHRSYCNNLLKNEIKDNRKLRARFNKKQIKAIKQGRAPDGYEWHHSEEEGLLQLVDKKAHHDASHRGGFLLWGEKGYKGE